MQESTGIVALAPELQEEIFQHCNLNDQLHLRATCRRLNSFLTPLIPQLSLPEECSISRMTLRQLHNSIHITVDIDDVATAQHFIDLGDRASKKWKRKENEKIRCWFVFPYPAPKQIPFFDRAKIAHFELDQRVPFHLSSENMQSLKLLLFGCTIYKLSLLFNASTMAQLTEVPALALMIQAKNVEFVLQSVAEIGEIASELATVGVKGVTITADPTCNVKLDLGFIGLLVRAGILKLTIEAEFGKSAQQQKRNYEQLMQDLSKSGKCATILIRSRCLPEYFDGLTYSNKQYSYVSRLKRDCSKDVLGKDEILITSL